VKKSLKTHFLGFKVINVDTPRQLLGGACYDKQQISVCDSFYVKLVIVAEIAHFEEYPNLRPHI